MEMLTSFHRFSRSAASVGRSALMAPTTREPGPGRSGRGRRATSASGGAGRARARGLHHGEDANCQVRTAVRLAPRLAECGQSWGGERLAGRRDAGPGRPDEDERAWVPVRRLGLGDVGGRPRGGPGRHGRHRFGSGDALRPAHLSRPRRPLAVDARPEPVHRHPPVDAEVRRLPHADRAAAASPSTLLSGDAVDAVRALKADGDGELVVLGSGDLTPAGGRRTGRRVPAGRSSRSSSVPVHDCSATRIPSSSRSGPRPSPAAPSSAGTASSGRTVEARGRRPARAPVAVIRAREPRCHARPGRTAHRRPGELDRVTVAVSRGRG